MIVSVCIVTAALYLGRELLIPLALTALLSFLLSPLVSRFERLGLGRVPSVMIVTIISSSALAGLLWLVTVQVTDLAGRAGEYKEQIRQKVRDVQSASSGPFQRFMETARELERELNPSDAGAAPSSASAQKGIESGPSPVSVPPAGASPENPVWARIVPAPGSPLSVIKDTLGPLLGPLGTLGIVAVLTIFVLINREDIRDRFIRLAAGEQRLRDTTQAMDEAGERVSRYLLMQLLVNVMYGVPVGFALFFLGVPNAPLWGLLATVLRFIPYVGPWVAAGLPIAISFAISPGWWLPILVISVFLVLELISNNIVEPLLYGKSTGTSAVALLVAAVYWTWVWGTAGLLLATPITVCLVVLGAHVPRLHFLTILLGDAPALEAPSRVYQRVLAGDSEEASDILYEQLKERSLVDVYDHVIVPAIVLAESDRHGGKNSTEDSALMHAELHTLIADVTDHALDAGGSLLDPPDQRKNPKHEDERDGNADAVRQARRSTRIACLPAGDQADELGALLLANLFELKGYSAEPIAVRHLAAEIVTKLEQEKYDAIVIAAVPPSALNHTRYLIKRLRGRFGETPIILTMWDAGEDIRRLKERVQPEPTMKICGSCAETLDQIRQLTQATGLTKQA